jgi:hypothetical protein
MFWTIHGFVLLSHVVSPLVSPPLSPTYSPGGSAHSVTSVSPIFTLNRPFTKSELSQESLRASDVGRSDTPATRIVQSIAISQPWSTDLNGNLSHLPDALSAGDDFKADGFSLSKEEFLKVYNVDRAGFVTSAPRTPFSKKELDKLLQNTGFLQSLPPCQGNHFFEGGVCVGWASGCVRE